MYGGKNGRLKIQPPVRGDWNDEARWEREGRRCNSRTAPRDSDYVRQLQIGCYAAVTHLGHQIGRLLSALVEEGLITMH